MNFDFSDDQKQLRDQARKYLAEKCPPKAVRAVGTANGDNHVSVLIPCHRVIRSDGTLGGYGGGLPNKKKLLAAEGIRLELDL